MASGVASSTYRWHSDLSAGSLADLGPSASERAFEIASRQKPAQPLPSAAEDPGVRDGDVDSEDDARSVMTITRTVTRVEDLPDNKSEAIGTVLEEQFRKPVQLMVEFLGSTTTTTEATRRFLNELYDAELELSLECQFLPKVDLFTNSDPFAQVYQRNRPNGPWVLLGRTETIIDAHFPRFVAKFKVQAVPERDMDKEILVRVFAKGSLTKAVRLGEASCNVWDIVSASGHCKVLRMKSVDQKKKSWIIMSGDIYRGRMHALNPRTVILSVRFEKSARPRSKTHFVINRGLSKGRWTPIYHSEGHSHPDREFRPVQVTFADMFCGDDRKQARIEFFQRRIGLDAKLAGFVQLSMRNIEHMKDGSILPWFSGKSAVPPGTIVLAGKEISRDAISVWLSVTNE